MRKGEQFNLHYLGPSRRRRRATLTLEEAGIRAAGIDADAVACNPHIFEATGFVVILGFIPNIPADVRSGPYHGVVTSPEQLAKLEGGLQQLLRNWIVIASSVSSFRAPSTMTMRISHVYGTPFSTGSFCSRLSNPFTPYSCSCSASPWGHFERASYTQQLSDDCRIRSKTVVRLWFALSFRGGDRAHRRKLCKVVAIFVAQDILSDEACLACSVHHMRKSC